MRHQKSGKKLNRTPSHRKAMFRNMVTSLFTHGRIKTTDAKAKELRRWADNMITLAKRGDLHARRQVLSVMRDKKIVHQLFEEAGDRFGDRSGGYTRITKIGVRRGDCAPISLIELVGLEKAAPGKKKGLFDRGKKKDEPEFQAQAADDEATAAEEADAAQETAEAEPEEQVEAQEEQALAQEAAEEEAAVPADSLVAEEEAPEAVEPKEEEKKKE